MSNLKLAIFDVDGTLVDSQNSIVSSMNAAFAALSKPVPDRQKLLSIVGLSLPQAFQILAPWASETENAEMVCAYKDHYAASRAGGQDGSVLYDGALDALHSLNKVENIQLGVATGKSRRGLDILFDNHDLHSLFVTSQVADNHPSKPHPAMVRSALAEAGVSASDAVMIGDTTYDLEMAAAAGVPSIGVTWGYHSRRSLEAFEPVAVINDFAELVPALMSRWGFND